MDLKTAQDLLSGLSAQLNELRGYVDEPKLPSFRRRARVVIEEIFGPQSEYLVELNRIQFTPSTRYFSASGSAPQDVRLWIKGCDEMNGLLEALVLKLSIEGLAHATPPSSSPEERPSDPKDRSADPRTVFVVHGRNAAARRAMFDFLRAIGLHPLEWSEATVKVPDTSPYIGDILDIAFKEAQAVVVLLSGDDEARLREPFRRADDEPYEKQLTPQARPNVLFEAGLAFGVQPKRVVLVEIGKLRPFSDIGGRHTVRITNTVASRQDLAQRLLKAGCEVNLGGVDWHTVGDFDGAAVLPAASKANSTLEPDASGQWYYHYRVQQLVLAGGGVGAPEYVFNQEATSFEQLAAKLEEGERFQMEGITLGGFEINNGFVSLSVLRSKEPRKTAVLKGASVEHREKYWSELRYSDGVLDITPSLKITDPSAKPK